MALVQAAHDALIAGGGGPTPVHHLLKNAAVHPRESQPGVIARLRTGPLWRWLPLEAP
jgi:hypothetical protein